MKYCLPTIVSVLMAAAVPASEENFVSLFDGKTLDGWKVSENPASVKVEDGAIVTNGKRAHAYYVGKVEGAKFKDFELRLEVKTDKNSNGGVYFHTHYREKGWPKEGYEIQVNNTHSDWRKTGGLYGVQDRKTSFADGEWMDYRILVVGKTITAWINGEKTVGYTEPEDLQRTSPRIAKDGATVALQAHDPGSTVRYRNIRIRPLPRE